MQYRTFAEPDYDALQALDLAAQRQADPAFDTLPAREREGRLSTSLPALKFYERSEHSFAAQDEAGEMRGLILAQHVWQGDRPIVLVRTVILAPDAPEGTAAGLLHATVKSAYDSAVYEVHFPLAPALEAAARREEAHLTGQYAVCHLGTRAGTAPGERLGTSPSAGAEGRA
ncbi:DUF1999 domain-containing protein [Deinococcus metallilatus]|uniref:DUF1999 domain-containing protein n=1 Tax=Deinococcus metallilatus TaxID=1211322 RepID=A0AAJ5K097_9DEIO|nr:DUF1999 domain-containing protein [Deinococcus metallilatus]MBB5294064.1 hypothetical protein [Deinococcus metallilatus]QBY08852.1 DUF1999 domain-containing protein [Deinococcus metallilatus]RXJ09996.1 DUF1999 domain-containing protein [Deinococcus metallilatus]TLK28067.1 DUF1999 domain-containing protein [Deinococcus metallilatus]GMA16601.1 GNAT family acetyltransferase [Deinococcus metallilatus]